jgi:hypothetical protein
VIVAVVIAVVVVVVIAVARRGRASDVQRVQVEGGKPWGGPAFLNGGQRVRLPSALPRAVELVGGPRVTDGPDTRNGRHVTVTRRQLVWVAGAGLLVWVLIGVGLTIGERL